MPGLIAQPAERWAYESRTLESWGYEEVSFLFKSVGLYLILNAFIDMLHGSLPKEGESLFYCHRWWLHGKGADARLSLGLKATSPQEKTCITHSFYLHPSFSYSSLWALLMSSRRVKAQFWVVLLLPHFSPESRWKWVFLAWLLHFSYGILTLSHQGCRRKLKTAWRPAKAQLMPSFSCRRHTHINVLLMGGWMIQFQWECNPLGAGRERDT